MNPQNRLGDKCTPPRDKRGANLRHWNKTLDPRNLAESGEAARDWRREVTLAETGDVRLAMKVLAPLGDQLVLDLGGGLGLHTLLFTQAGARVVIADISVERLKAARAMIRRAGFGGEVLLVVCGAEELPFRDHVFDRQFTKSVLIHTHLRDAAAELARTLSPKGRAAFIEPLTGNPFVNLYRRLAAPTAWRHITDYFTPGSIKTLRQAYRRAGFSSRAHSLYFFAFFASVFHFLISSPTLFRAVERALLGVDNLLFALLPGLKRMAWFTVVELFPPARER